MKNLIEQDRNHDIVEKLYYASGIIELMWTKMLKIFFILLNMYLIVTYTVETCRKSPE